MNETYNPGLPDRKIMGAILPWISKEIVEDIYGKVPWSHWGTLSVSRTHLGKDDSMVVPTRVAAQFKGTARWDQKLRSMLLIPNGQVKNFLVACRTYWGQAGNKNVSICVRGSKAHQGGGVWYLYYALWLSTKSKKVDIACYDYAETPGVEDLEWDGKQIRIERTAAPYDGTGIGYDGVIDDAYLPGSGIVAKRDYVAQAYSIKEKTGSFLHATEGRYFSETPEPGTRYCECMVCRVCSDVSTSYDEYVYLRRICTVLGHDSKCLSDPAQHDLVVKGETLREILSQPTFRVSPGVIARSVLAVASEIPLKVMSNNIVALNPTGPLGLSFAHGIGALRPQQDYEVCERLRGKRVLFVGVLPDVLGSTELAQTNVKAAYHSPYDAVFASGVEAVRVNTAASVIYIPVKPEDFHEEDWRSTGYRWKAFYEYSYIPAEVLGAPSVSGSLKCKGLPYPSKDPNSLQILTHPVHKMLEATKSSVLFQNFHCSRTDGLIQIDSDFPLSHVYENQPIVKCERGLMEAPRLRTYDLRHGYYEGSDTHLFDPDQVQCFVEIRSGKMIWDFIYPDTWHHLIRTSPDTLRQLSKTHGYVGISDFPGNPFSSFVPPTWGEEEVAQVYKVLKPIREPWGWRCPTLDFSRMDKFVAGVYGYESDDPILKWFKSNLGWLKHFTFDKKNKGYQIVGLNDWSKFFNSYHTTSLSFVLAVKKGFSLSADGPYDASIDIRNYTRTGQPRKKKAGKKN